MSMADTPFSGGARDNRIRLRTLINLRWIAVLGQTITLVIAAFFLTLRVEFGLCFLAVGSSVIANLLAMTVFPVNQRLNDRDAMLTLLFDVAQLTFLLFLTGGLNNPFALLFIAPVTISATALSLRSTIFLGLVTLVLISALATFHIPLRTQEGFILEMPEIYLWGFWVAIIVGTLFLAAYAHRVTQERNAMSDALFATQMALTREQKLTDLGGVIAAAAHELGTPLATIKLVSSELADELRDNDLLREDAELIHQQADRCRDILRSMGRAGKDDLHIRSIPISGLVREAAEPHSNRGITLIYSFTPLAGGDDKQPNVQRKPELLHGLRNMIQNAVDFAHGRVWIDAHWNDKIIQIRVIDDGAGYPPELIRRIGDPFLRRRKPARASQQRKGYEGMGLGLFIAKTLLERTGAKVAFANGTDPFLTNEESGDRSGAIVDVTWPREAVVMEAEEVMGPLGENQLIDP
jgi:two-component system sensor histidine kinase RegB